jgi:hypothetical protein
VLVFSSHIDGSATLEIQVPQNKLTMCQNLLLKAVTFQRNIGHQVNNAKMHYTTAYDFLKCSGVVVPWRITAYNKITICREVIAKINPDCTITYCLPLNVEVLPSLRKTNSNCI